MFSISVMAFQEVIHHVFLPRVLPEENKYFSIDSQRDTNFLLEKFAGAVGSISGEFVPSPVKKLFENMAHRYCVEDPRATIFDQLSSFGETDLLGYYLPNDNCGLLLRGLPDGRATFASFQIDVPERIVYGKNVHNDIQVHASF